MRKLFYVSTACLAVTFMSCSFETVSNADKDQQKKTEMAMQEANKQIGMPAVINFQEKKNLSWIYELCDQEDLICHAYLFNEMKGEIGQYLGECIGYGIPYSTQFSNPQKLARADMGQYTGEIAIPQAEPNGLFKPEGLSATWLIMIDPKTKQPRPIYVEPMIIVSPFKLK